MKIVYSLILFNILFLPALSYAVLIPPATCPCSEANINETTGAEILDEICPDGELSPDAELIFNQEEISVFTTEPVRNFATGPFAPMGFNACEVGLGPGSVATGITDQEFEACRNTIIEACGLNPNITRPIPTLSEWGLIAMAGILGLVGVFVIRRKRAAA